MWPPWPSWRPRLPSTTARSITKRLSCGWYNWIIPANNHNPGLHNALLSNPGFFIEIWGKKGESDDIISQEHIRNFCIIAQVDVARLTALASLGLALRFRLAP